MSFYKNISIIIPVFNESESLPTLYQRLTSVLIILKDLNHEYEMIFVSDGSTDATHQIIQNWIEEDPRIRLIVLSRNFGHQSALSAGLDYADGDIVITMDGDGQHPPELIPKLLAQYEMGHDIVLTQRLDDKDLSLFKRKTSHLFYLLINYLGDTEIIPASADFRLMSRQVVLNLRRMPEQHRFLRGMITWMGYRTAIVPFQAPSRIAGKSKYTIVKMLRFALNAIFSFSLIPIQLSFLLGIGFIVVAICEVIYVMSFFVSGTQNQLTPGWSSLMFVLLLFCGIILIMLGLVGYYIGFIFLEVKRRPLYFVRDVYPKSKNRDF